MIGLVVNPVAGVGGPAGLAGSDGAGVQRLAQARGAHSRALERAAVAVTTLASRHPGIRIATVAGAMGEDAVRAAGLEPDVLERDVLRRVAASASGEAADDAPRSADVEPQAPNRDAEPPKCDGGHPAEEAGSVATSGADTTAAVAALCGSGVTLILVAGGDGTLRDAAAGRTGDTALLGIPTGVKMYSAAFAVSPRAAGALAADWLDGDLPTAEREVLDVDEEAMRHARVEPVLYATVPVPFRVGRTQSRKAATPVSEAAAVGAAARGAIARMRPGVRYLLGPGGTTAEIARQLGLTKSPLGVDVILDGETVCAAASEADLLAQIAAGPAQAVVTVIGGQGFVLGRGNQQLSAAVIDAIGDDPLLVVAPEQKLVDLHGRPLLVDTGDADLDARLRGHVRIITGPATTSLYAVAAADTVA